jgi:hypothetical protein
MNQSALLGIQFSSLLRAYELDKANISSVLNNNVTSADSWTAKRPTRVPLLLVTVGTNYPASGVAIAAATAF